MEPSGRVTEERIVGRAADVAAIETFVSASAQNAGALVLTGPAGIGKTALWREALRRARSVGIRVLASRPSEVEATLDYAGLTDLLNDVDDETLRLLPGAQARALGVALRRAEPEALPPDPLSVGLATLGLLRRLAHEGPILVAVDDVQWLDPASLRAVQFAFRRLERTLVALLATERTVRGSVAPTASGMAGPSISTREIGPLSLDGLEDLLRLHLGVGFLRPTLLRIEAASGGNPFYALEIGRGLLRRGIRFAPDVLPIPDTLTGIVRERLEALLPSASDVTLLAAVLASPTPRAIRSALPAGGDGLASARRAGILVETADAIRFTHPLLASVAYESVTPERRRAAHRLAARVADDPEEQGRHLALAASRPSERVARAAEAASTRARSRGSSEEAAALAELAYRLTPASRPTEARRRAIRAAEHSVRAGDPGRAIALLDGVSAPPGPARAELLVAVADAHSSGDWEARLRLLEEAAMEAGESPPRIVAERLLAGAGMVMDRDLPGAIAHGRTAVRLAEEFDDPTQLALSLAMLCRVEAAADGTVDHAALERALRLAPALQFVHVIARPDYAFAEIVPRRRGDLADQIRLIGAIRAEAVQVGDWDGALPVTSFAAELCLDAGDWPRALELATEAEQLSHQVGQPGLRALVLNAYARVLAHIGRVDEAVAALDEAVTQGGIVRGTGLVRASAMIRGFLELTRGDPAAADAAMAPAVSWYIREGRHDPERLRKVGDEIEALCLLGRPDDAARVLLPFERHARSIGSPVVRAIAQRCAAVIVATRGDVATALSVLRGIVDGDLSGEPFEQARTRLLLGELARRQRRIGEARRSLTAAAEQFDHLGASDWAAKARLGLARLAGRRPIHGLTETERQIARLAATGSTKREIADVLFMSPHTVDSHLRRIYQTLAVRSRAELAGRLAAAGEATPPPVRSTVDSRDHVISPVRIRA